MSSNDPTPEGAPERALFREQTAEVAAEVLRQSLPAEPVSQDTLQNLAADIAAEVLQRMFAAETADAESVVQGHLLSVGPGFNCTGTAFQCGATYNCTNTHGCAGLFDCKGVFACSGSFSGLRL